MPEHTLSDHEPAECDACRYPAPTLKTYDLSPMSTWKQTGRTTKTLCPVCASTMNGVAYDYPEQYPEHRAMALTAWGINYVADVAAGRVER